MIKLENLTKQFVQKKGQPLKAVDNVNLNVPEGEMCVLLGPSGCGKTTTLKMINRLIAPSSGNILINGENTNDMDTVTLRRNIGYVIQQIGLFPNMTIEENITVVPRMLGWGKARCKQRAEDFRITGKAEDNLRIVLSRLYESNTSWMPIVDEDGRYNGEISQDYIADYLSSGRTRRALNIHESS
ncbi:ATP-binding cassette domain-containing protein [Salmonella enterica]|nr:ATP-binding cassette domain-containing protein [Salmonella enterica]EEE0987300.1 ATP-binding cassette domain-containing protein [Salmonella enterica subsp. enterica serovar Kiambu]ECR8728740.1 ATP-binding cassette domain-containing protein [Salmonella enterica]EDY3019631.1 ATP-binding cassette domain-containing protein [Salmonella enterica]EEF7292564.1 ATP-binding cassette domain-containing protein [Salmonella enterica]